MSKTWKYKKRYIRFVPAKSSWVECASNSGTAFAFEHRKDLTSHDNIRHELHCQQFVIENDGRLSLRGKPFMHWQARNSLGNDHVFRGYLFSYP